MDAIVDRFIIICDRDFIASTKGYQRTMDTVCRVRLKHKQG